MTSHSEPRITVVIVNYNRRRDLREALLSVERQEGAPAAVIVVDNASDDGSRAMVEAEFPRVELVGLGENLGMAGYSLGFERARSELVFQMDNDSLLPDPGVLEGVARRFEEGPEELAAVACRVEEYRAESDRVEELRARDRRRGPLVTGGFHAGGVGFRRRRVIEVGSYPREVFLYGSELFLQMQLLARGHAVHYFPELLVLHKSSGVARSSQAVYFELRNRYWFLRRFADRRQRLRFFPAMLAHDLIYALAKRRPGALLQALRDGFGPMPDEIRQPLRSTRPAFRAKVDEVGARFGPAALAASLARRVRS